LENYYAGNPVFLAVHVSLAVSRAVVSLASNEYDPVKLNVDAIPQ
jgi:hypothetical protein